ncbi:MAG TPA: Ion transporter [Lachnospiraceae bacterium]|nr:Ion transporter [Lachnospiraceae bacterium]
MKNKISKKRIFDILQIGNREDIPSRAFDIVIAVAIVLNIFALVMSTFEELSAYHEVFNVIEAITICIFCIEYSLRIWTAEYLYPDLDRPKAVMKFIVSFDGIIDLMTILPFFFLYGFAAFRMLRVVRIFHLFRLNATYDSFNVITTVLSEKKNQILSSVFIILVLIMGASLCMYSVEHDAQPEAFRNAFSGIWWSVATIFTVGYGDIYPVTLLGRIMAVVITFLGVGAVAIPTGIISAGFVEQYTQMQEPQRNKNAEHNTISVTIDENSTFRNRSVSEIESEDGIDVSVLIRDGAILLATDALIVRQGDILVYQTSR